MNTTNHHATFGTKAKIAIIILLSIIAICLIITTILSISVYTRICMTGTYIGSDILYRGSYYRLTNIPEEKVETGDFLGYVQSYDAAETSTPRRVYEVTNYPNCIIVYGFLSADIYELDDRPRDPYGSPYEFTH